MISTTRNTFNAAFTENKYQLFLESFENQFPKAIDFRLAETPVFIPKAFENQLLDAGNYIANFILSPNFNAITNAAISGIELPPNAEAFPQCLVMDFAISENKGAILPQLIELQGFPSLFAFEIAHHHAFTENYSMFEDFTPFLNDYDENSYLIHLETILKGANKDKHTILLEIEPATQKTRIDFYYTHKFLNIPTVCLSEIDIKENTLFYKREGKEIKIDRIYNRIVWDEIATQDIVLQQKAALLLNHLAIEWVSHPEHYYRISKFLLPLLQHSLIPEAILVSELKEIPKDLVNYILKPLFSFAGQGVKIEINQEDIKNIKDPHLWILQRKVHYAEIIDTPSGRAKAEIRLFYFYDQSLQKYIATFNLTRISKGKMIGVSYNQNSTWVGGSLSYFEK